MTPKKTYTMKRCPKCEGTIGRLYHQEGGHVMRPWLKWYRCRNCNWTGQVVR